MVIREAGTHSRPSADAFKFEPAPSSPIYGAFRKSVDGSVHGKKWRNSTASLKSIDQSTQTDGDVVDSPLRNSQRASPHRTGSQEHDIHDSPERQNSFSDIDSDAEIHEATPVVSKARVVTVPKRVPPALPPRNPGRVGSPLAADAPPTDGFDQISLNGTSEEQKIVEAVNPEAVKDDEGLSRESTVGRGDASDKFESVPNTPTEEKKDDFS